MRELLQEVANCGFWNVFVSSGSSEKDWRSNRENLSRERDHKGGFWPRRISIPGACRSYRGCSSGKRASILRCFFFFVCTIVCFWSLVSKHVLEGFIHFWTVSSLWSVTYCSINMERPNVKLYFFGFLFFLLYCPNTSNSQYIAKVVSSTQTF